MMSASGRDKQPTRIGTEEGPGDGPHDRCTDAIAEKLYLIPAGAAFYLVRRDGTMLVTQPNETHRALQFIDLQHSKGRLAPTPLHQPKAIQSGKRAERAIERLPSAS